MRFVRFLRLPLLLIAFLVAAVGLATPAMAAAPVSATASVLPAHDSDHDGHGKHEKRKDGHDKGKVTKSSAATVTIAGGKTTLTVAAGTVKVLTKNGVSVKATSGASGSAPTFSFPITGGSVVAATAAGTITHRGGLTFTAGGTSLTVKNFTVDTKRGVLTAQVGNTGTRIALLNLDASKAKITKSGGNLVVSNVSATLTSQAAAALNKTFTVKLFKAGLPIGTAKVSAKPASKG